MGALRAASVLAVPLVLLVRDNRRLKVKKRCSAISLALTLLTQTGGLEAQSNAAPGTVLWQQTLVAAHLAVAESVTVDNQGNVVAAGVMSNTLFEFIVAKFDRDGTLLWQHSTGVGHAFSVAVDHQGNVVAAGRTYTGADAEFTVVKFDRDGTLLWLRTLNGTRTNGFDTANSVAIDKQGNVVAAGSIQNGSDDFMVAKFDGDGTLLWQRTLEGTGDDTGFGLADSVAVDNQGNVVAAGLFENAGHDYELAVAKFDRDGTRLWQQILDGPANGNDGALSVAVDNQGNVVAAGFIQNRGAIFPFSVDLAVVKFDRDGALLWQQSLHGTHANGRSVAVSAALDNEGNVVAAGYTENTGTGLDFTVAKFDRDGTLVWQRTLAGNGSDEALSVAADNQGNVVAAGFLENTGARRDFTVVKFDRDGALLWQHNLDGSAYAATAVAVDQQGHVIAAGERSGFTVVKLDR
jgi:uncharacterized delta-60 repeat protein